MTALSLLAGLFIFIAAGKTVMSTLSGKGREIAFALLNVAGVYWFLFHDQRSSLTKIALYLGLIVIQFVALRLFASQGGAKPWLAFFTPLGALILVRYFPDSAYVQLGDVMGMHLQKLPEFVGYSYLAFRSSRLVLEIRNGAVKMPDLWQYLGFCFFLPTMQVGPINTYENYRRGFEATPPTFAVGRALLRLLVGFIKFRFLGTLCNQLAYSNLILNDHPHSWFDLGIAMIFYYLFLYCNFSGFCDMAIGAAGLIGIPVPENFNHPLSARNMREFWNRWHITLSQYMRDVVFSPLSKFLVQLFGPEKINLAIALSILVVFLLIGIWHGPGWNYAVFGLLQGVGVITTHYYTLALKRWLGRDGFKAYNANPFIHAAAVTITFSYYAMTLFFFANSPEEIKAILAALQ